MDHRHFAGGNGAAAAERSEMAVITHLIARRTICPTIQPQTLIPIDAGPKLVK